MQYDYYGAQRTSAISATLKRIKCYLELYSFGNLRLSLPCLPFSNDFAEIIFPKEYALNNLHDLSSGIPGIAEESSPTDKMKQQQEVKPAPLQAARTSAFKLPTAAVSPGNTVIFTKLSY